MVMLPWAVIGPQEMTLVAIGILVLFGAKKLPELARGMGEGMREFKKAVKDINTEEEPTATTATGATPAGTAPAQVAQAPRPDTPEDVEKRIVH